MNILLITLGSRGDINPFIGLGLELKKRGHDITIISSEIYEPLVKNYGLKFAACSPAANYHEIIKHPDLYHPRKSLKLLAQYLMLDPMRSIYKIIEQFHPRETVVVAQPLAYGARIANEKWNYRLIQACLFPMAFWSYERPPIFPNAARLAMLPKFLQKMLLKFIDNFVLDPIFAPQVNQFREELGLAETKHIYSTWQKSPDQIIGFFPEWYAAPAADWPKNVALTGFIHFDENPNQELPLNIAKFLAEGKAPLLFTYGTSMAQSKKFFAKSLEAARRLKQRVILLTQFPEQLPPLNANNELHVSYLPLQKILPHAAAMIHHGGIGTLFHTLAAKVPQMIVPSAHDQFDNAAHIERLGVGLSLLPERYSVENATQKIQELLESNRIKSACVEYAGKIDFQKWLDETCDLIEKH